MAGVIREGAHLLAKATQELKGFEQELESANLVGEWQIQRKPRSKGDGFVVPNWCWHRHRNLTQEESLLFSVSDAPLLKAVQLYREEGKD